jgi:hypothetical protein
MLYVTDCVRLIWQEARRGKVKVTPKLIAIICIVLPAFMTPVLAQQGFKRTPLGTMDFPPGHETIMGLAEIGPASAKAAIHILVSRPLMSSKGKV